jgi:hypothetical protein
VEQVVHKSEVEQEGRRAAQTDPHLRVVKVEATVLHSRMVAPTVAVMVVRSKTAVARTKNQAAVVVAQDSLAAAVVDFETVSTTAVAVAAAAQATPLEHQRQMHLVPVKIQATFLMATEQVTEMAEPVALVVLQGQLVTGGL